MLCETCKKLAGLENGGDANEERGGILQCELCRLRRQNERIEAHLAGAGSSPAALSSVGGNKEARAPLARILCLHGFRQTSQNFRGRLNAFRNRLKRCAEFQFIDAPHAVPDMTFPTPMLQQQQQQWQQKRSRRGWLVLPEQYKAVHSASGTLDATVVFDDHQYQNQTCGWEESLGVLEKALEENKEKGNAFDGILGFSQGAAVAAVCAALESQRPKDERRFKFVILCSGYVSHVPGHRELMQPHLIQEEERSSGVAHMRASRNASFGIPIPSLHVYCAAGKDRQIGNPDSVELCECFDAESRVCLLHSAGHLVPATRAATNRIANFIEWARNST